jgi:Helix-turn-helix.
METVRELPHQVVAGEVRAALARRRISGRKAAREIGWTPAYIGRRLSGEAPLDVNDLVALAQLLDVPLTSFFPEVIINGGGVPVGSNKQYYSTPPEARIPYPTCMFITPGRPDAAELALAA